MNLLFWKRKCVVFMEVLPILPHQRRNLVEQFAILLVTTVCPVTYLAILNAKTRVNSSVCRRHNVQSPVAGLTLPQYQVT